MGADVRVCVPPAKLELGVCVCLSAVILHGSVHKSDYHKNTAENRLLIVF